MRVKCCWLTKKPTGLFDEKKKDTTTKDKRHKNKGVVSLCLDTGNDERLDRSRQDVWKDRIRTGEEERDLMYSNAKMVFF